MKKKKRQHERLNEPQHRCPFTKQSFMLVLTISHSNEVCQDSAQYMQVMLSHCMAIYQSSKRTLPKALC